VRAEGRLDEFGVLPEPFRAPGFQVLEVLTGKVPDRLSEFAGEKLFVGAHTEQDFFAEAKHISGHCRGGVVSIPPLKRCKSCYRTFAKR
jgi:hypothetical protein